jgi:Tfp pilus assembly protein PilP
MRSGSSSPEVPMWLTLCSLGLADEVYVDEVYEVFNYDPIGKRDPFSTLFKELPTAPKEGILAWEIDELRLVGVTTGLEPTALFVDPTGESWIVHEGDYVGRFWGLVTDIEGDTVRIREEYLDMRNNGLVVKPYDLTLPRD